MSFVHDASVEADTPRSNLCPSSYPPNQSETPVRKRRNSSDELAQKRSLVYDAALKFMRQPSAIPEASKTDNDRFGEYVASQLRCMDPRAKMVMRAEINNLFFRQQLNDQQQQAYTINPYSSFLPSFNSGFSNINK